MAVFCIMSAYRLQVKGQRQCKASYENIPKFKFESLHLKGES